MSSLIGSGGTRAPYLGVARSVSVVTGLRVSSKVAVCWERRRARPRRRAPQPGFCAAPTASSTGGGLPPRHQPPATPGRGSLGCQNIVRTASSTAPGGMSRGVFRSSASSTRQSGPKTGPTCNRTRSFPNPAVLQRSSHGAICVWRISQAAHCGAVHSCPARTAAMMTTRRVLHRISDRPRPWGPVVDVHARSVVVGVAPNGRSLVGAATEIEAVHFSASQECQRFTHLGGAGGRCAVRRRRAASRAWWGSTWPVTRTASVWPDRPPCR